MRIRIECYLCPHLLFRESKTKPNVSKMLRNRKNVENKEYNFFGESKKIVTFEDLKCAPNALVKAK